ncbi:DUF5712 family protein [Pedobacter aquatilis]|uniref:DUF5712 family protein n=1 Tax=Pedobacter aquatilis TaxID=351343 RepID=UPI00292FB96E|nr:DUF5712 family protein [Pedobacter aquatilis]
MYINITDKQNADNKGSSSSLVNYLEKENRVHLSHSPELWFNQSSPRLEPFEVRQQIDANVAKLCRNDAKFYLINISPSLKELQHMEEKFGPDGISAALKAYTEMVMDEYARNFNRPGINSNQDLLWFAKLEHNRYYGHGDKEVKDGKKKRGELKTGDQRHIQVIVSRKDISNKIKLSPMNTSRGRNIEHSKKMGQFDRLAFKRCGEALFDKAFNFERGLKDTLDYANILKNGTIEQRKQLDALSTGIKFHNDLNKVAPILARQISEAAFDNTTMMLKQVGSTTAGFLDIMLDPVASPSNPQPGHMFKKKKKKKGQHQDHSQQLIR